MSRHHAAHPYTFHVGEQEYRVAYLPAESDSGLFGGNFNWRGPVWFPVNALIVRALQHLHSFYGDDGAGLGAAHQTGWTALVAVLLIMKDRLSAVDVY